MFYSCSIHVTLQSFLLHSRNPIYCTLMSRFFSFHVTLGLYIFIKVPGQHYSQKRKTKQNHKHNNINNNNNWTSPLHASTGCPGPLQHNKICAIETHSMQSPHFSMTVLYRVSFSCKTKIHRNIKGYLKTFRGHGLDINPHLDVTHLASSGHISATKLATILNTRRPKTCALMQFKYICSLPFPLNKNAVPK